MFEIALTVTAVLAGGVAAVVGFGIGSLLTPLLAAQVGTKLAVAAISIPHACATALRLWFMRRHIDKPVLWSFGVASAAGGLVGALLHAWAGSAALTILFGCLLCFAGIAGLTGLAARMRFEGAVAWTAGGLSGLFGGMVGNQGGIRSAALLGFDVSRDAFVGTATAVALMIDAVRMPVYLASEGRAVLDMGYWVLLMTAGALVGTIVGRRLLPLIPELLFRKVVSVLIVLLGVYMLYKGIAPT